MTRRDLAHAIGNALAFATLASIGWAVVLAFVWGMTALAGR